MESELEPVIAWCDKELKARLLHITSQLDRLEARLGKELSAPGVARVAELSTPGVEHFTPGVSKVDFSELSTCASIASSADQEAQGDPGPRAAFLSSSCELPVPSEAALIDWKPLLPPIEEMEQVSCRSTLKKGPTMGLRSTTKPIRTSLIYDVQTILEHTMSCKRDFRALSTSTRNRGHCQTVICHFLEEPESSMAAFCYSIMIPSLTVFSAIFTLAHSLNEPESQGMEYMLSEITFDMFSAAELLVRYIVAPHSMSFAMNPFNLLDLTVIPSLICRVSVGHTVSFDDLSDFRSVFLLLVVPILRLLRGLRYFETIHLLLEAFRRTLEALPVLLFVLVVQVMFFASLIYYVEPRENIGSMPTSIWLTIVTMMTVGYGDVTPESTAGTVIVSVLIVSGTLYMAIPLGIVGNAFSQIWQDRDRLLLMQKARNRILQEGFEAKDLAELFQIYGAQQDGCLTLCNFRDMLKSMKIGLREDRIVQLYNTFDSDGNGTVDVLEFMRFLFPAAALELQMLAAQGSQLCSEEG
eukprot:CAMPEP_0170575872 /NCGR_PEP_ID=MMETSP0224-20130122/4094_1 /TAXON_ID=285029 /ORGANISM="Togula jolla, Strain CCCM 725" /LENGTH=525 /DNA_ID=CAMNT_0010898683 /DNA_START=1 /DNA_END=1578 /DNA_ORIENTATION=-